jgi:Transposase DDE domain
MSYSTSRSHQAPAKPRSFLDFFRFFFTAQLCKQIHQAFPAHPLRWQPQPLIFVLLSMTWCCGDSQAERFETAKAFYTACYQRKKRPGKTLEGFQKALARVPTAWLRLVAGLVRQRLAQVFADRFEVNGFVPLGCDGSRLACPRSAELQKHLTHSQLTPQVWVTALVHLSLGIPWSWRLGRGNKASERTHLRQLVTTLPPRALLVTDAGYPGYELLQALVAQRVAFLMRLSSTAPLYSPERMALYRFREGLVYYWTKEAQKEEREPIRVRLLRIVGSKGDVWLITNVLEAEKLSRKMAGTFYRWRWRNEGFFRTYKRTLGKVKLMSRTIALAHREAEGSLLAVQMLLAQGSLALQQADEVVVTMPSARQVLLTIRVEIRNVTGMYLGPRQRQTYLQRLENTRQPRRKKRFNKIRQTWSGREDHKPPKAPKVLKMGGDLKRLLERTLGSA